MNSKTPPPLQLLGQNISIPERPPHEILQAIRALARHLARPRHELNLPPHRNPRPAAPGMEHHILLVHQAVALRVAAEEHRRDAVRGRDARVRAEQRGALHPLPDGVAARVRRAGVGVEVRRRREPVVGRPREGAGLHDGVVFLEEGQRGHGAGLGVPFAVVGDGGGGDGGAALDFCHFGYLDGRWSCFQRMLVVDSSWGSEAKQLTCSRSMSFAHTKFYISVKVTLLYSDG